MNEEELLRMPLELQQQRLQKEEQRQHQTQYADLWPIDSFSTHGNGAKPLINQRQAQTSSTHESGFEVISGEESGLEALETIDLPIEDFSSIFETVGDTAEVVAEVVGEIIGGILS